MTSTRRHARLPKSRFFLYYYSYYYRDEKREREVTVLDFETVNLEVVFAEGFRSWADDLSQDEPGMTAFQSLPNTMKAILRHDLMKLYDLVEDSSTLRVLGRIRDSPLYRSLQEEARQVWQRSCGRMTSSVMEYVLDSFVDTIEVLSRDMGWSVIDRVCNVESVIAVIAAVNGENDSSWIRAASHTPCLCVNEKASFSFDTRVYSSFDGLSPDRICKSDVNLYDLFRVVACDGDVLVLKQKNGCSVSLVPSLVYDGSKRYIFEIGGFFASFHDSYAFLYLTNGIVCQPILKEAVSSTDEWYMFFEGRLNVTYAAIACRFGVPYTTVCRIVNYMNDNNQIIGDHCDIDSGNNSMWNLRLALAADGENESNRGADFAFQFLGQMKDDDRSMFVSNFLSARDSQCIYRLYCPHGDTHSPGEDSSVFQALEWVGSDCDSCVWYFDTECDDTILIKSGNPYETNLEVDDIFERFEFLSMRLYTTRMLCDVSDCAAQQRDAQITIGGVDYSVSRSLVFSNELHQSHEGEGGFNGDGRPCYIRVTDKTGRHFTVEHMNGQVRHNFSSNLFLILEEEEYTLDQQIELIVHGEKEENEEISPMSIEDDGKSDLHSFELVSSTTTERVRCTIDDLSVLLHRRRVPVKKYDLRRLLERRPSKRRQQTSPNHMMIHHLDSNGHRIGTMTRSIKDPAI